MKKFFLLFVASGLCVACAGFGISRFHQGSSAHPPQVSVQGETILRTDGSTTLPASSLPASSSGDTDAFTMPISGTVSDLWPGAPAALVLTIDNPNGFDASVTGLSVAAGDASGCPGSNLTVGSFSGPLTVAAHTSATTTIPLNVAASAPTACQGATFPLTYTAQAEQQ